MTREAAIIATLVLYKIALIAVGWFARRRVRDGNDYFLAGRSLGPGTGGREAERDCEN